MKVKLYCKQAAQEQFLDELFKGYGLEYDATEDQPSLQDYKVRDRGSTRSSPSRIPRAIRNSRL